MSAFLAGPGPVTSAWHIKYHALKGFFRFAVSRGHIVNDLLPMTRPKRPPRFVPHIYSRADLRRLLDATQSYPRAEPSRIEPITMRAMLLLMYGAGLRPGETLHLSAADVDLANALLTIRNTKFFKSRLVPIGPDLTQVLSEYVRWRAVAHPRSAASAPSSSAAVPARRFNRSTIEDTVSNGCASRPDSTRSDGGRYQPRLHDLRHTFAVHRLTSWYRQGADVQRLLHHLSVYLGHAHLAATQVYLTMTPELLHEAGTRFERYARGENGHA